MENPVSSIDQRIVARISVILFQNLKLSLAVVIVYVSREPRASTLIFALFRIRPTKFSTRCTVTD